jgi:hypothetical protein
MKAARWQKIDYEVLKQRPTIEVDRILAMRSTQIKIGFELAGKCESEGAAIITFLAQVL